MDRLGIEHEIVDAVEIDKYAMASFNAIHGTNFEPQDITTWNKDIECDLIMHGSPCQDFSLAGKQAGGDIGSGTRSSLMYETVRIVGKLRPKYVVWENVKNVLSKKHRHNFDNYLTAMKSLGYANFYEVLNAKDYGIPQNRERVFTVSVLGGSKFDFPKGSFNENKIIELNSNGKHQQDFLQDENGLCRCIPAGTHGSTPHLLKTLVRNFDFPPKQELKLRLKDMLEDEVDRKYYLTDEQIKNFVKNNNGNCNPSGKGMNGQVYSGDIAPTITTNKGEGSKIITETNVVGNLVMNKWQDSMKRIYDIEKYAPTINTMQGGNRQPKIMSDMAIRKLTPKECWRLMGFDDKDFEKAAQVNSNTQLYKQAGNSIVVNVLEAIFKELFEKEVETE